MREFYFIPSHTSNSELCYNNSKSSYSSRGSNNKEAKLWPQGK